MKRFDDQMSVCQWDYSVSDVFLAEFEIAEKNKFVVIERVAESLF